MDRIDAERNLATYRHNIALLSRINLDALNADEVNNHWKLLRRLKDLEKNLENQLYSDGKVKR